MRYCAQTDFSHTNVFRQLMLKLVGLTLHSGRGQVGSTARVNEYEVLCSDRLLTHKRQCSWEDSSSNDYMVLRQARTAANHLLVDT